MKFHAKEQILLVLYYEEILKFMSLLCLSREA